MITNLFNFLMVAFKVLKSGLSAGSSAQQRFINADTSSSQQSSAVEGRKHLAPLQFFTLSTISVNKIK